MRGQQVHSAASTSGRAPAVATAAQPFNRTGRQGWARRRRRQWERLNLDLGLYSCPLVDATSMRKAGICCALEDDDPWDNIRPPPPPPQQASNNNNNGGPQPPQQPRSSQGWSNRSSSNNGNVGDNGGGAGGGLQPSAQMQRLRQLMQNLGIAGLPGLGMDMASRVASGGGNGQQVRA
ncbi:hypothetical protein DUNSADRAFT_4784 [Dunaliella salina]|uniref:Encoded protein n=1 Tax=Dunaliella salina TaxID=3046 RepID=A0ABQ7GRD0_DUNSA|nr:hypothetical protein DUNSADRAFT_4784 [Dunaliella salina]|eukprot:KAF5837163.1 hypothetical protein DUNSADRAFT_4784 [Dunaliella salina]